MWKIFLQKLLIWTIDCLIKNAPLMIDWLENELEKLKVYIESLKYHNKSITIKYKHFRKHTNIIKGDKH